MTDRGHFDSAFGTVLPIEGGLVDNKRDPGGITKYGVSLRFAQSVADLSTEGHALLDVDGNGEINADDIRALTVEQAADIFFTYFWKLLRCDEFNSVGIALSVFDMGINQGRGPAIATLQAALGIKVDGRPGPVTMGAANALQFGAVIDCLNEFTARRALRYATTANFDAFGLGWMRRAVLVHEHAIQLERA